MKREGVPTLGRSLSFDFCDYGATINDYQATFKRLCNDYRLSTFERLSDYPATIDFATISGFSDFRTAGGDPDGGWAIGVSMEMSRGSTFVAVSGSGSAASLSGGVLFAWKSARHSVFERFQAFLRRLVV